MANCPKCNAPLREGQKFCTKCGAKVPDLAKPKLPLELAASVDIHEKKIDQDPLNSTLYIALGDLYYAHSFYEDALVQYQKVVNIDPAKTEGHLKSGNSYGKLGKLDQAKGCYEKALQILPECADAMMGLFFALKELGRLAEASVLGKKITTAGPSNIHVHKGLRDIYMQTRKEDETIAEIKTIITLAPSEKDSYRQLAQIYIKRKEEDKALENYRKILSLDDKDKDALLHIGSLLYEKGDFDESTKYLRRLGAIDPSNVSALSFLALNSTGGGDLDNATKTLNSIASDYEKLREDEKKLLSHTYFILGEKYLQITNLNDAKSHFLKSSEVSQNLDAAKVLAGIYAREGEVAFLQKTYKNAEGSFGQALKLDPNNRLYQGKFNEARRIRVRKQRNVVFAITIPVLFVGLLAGAFFLYGHYSTGELIINTLSDEQVTRIQIDGKEYTPTKGPIKLKKGEHKIFVKGKPGYNDLTSTIQIEGGDKKEIAVSLDSAKIAVPASDQDHRSEAGAQSPEPAPEGTMNEQESIRRFYLAVQNKRVDDAVSMYASEKRPKINRNLIETVAKDTEYYRFEKMETIHKDGTTAKVQVLMLHKKYKRPAEYWENTIELVKENNRWMIWSTPGNKIR